MRKLAITTILFFCFVLTYANNGGKNEATKVVTSQRIEGKIIDKSTNEALAGVALMLNGSSSKYYTDFEGNFVIDGVEPGIYDIDILYVSYEGVTLEDISTNETGLKLKVELESVSH